MQGDIATVVLAALLALGGSWCMALWKVMGDRARPRLPGVGAVSDNTLILTGLASLAVAYHLLAHRFQWGGIKAPLPIALAAAAIVVALSVLLDAATRDDAHDNTDQDSGDS